MLIPAAPWKTLKDIILNGISQTQKDKYCVSPLVPRVVPRVVEFIATRSRMVMTRDGGADRAMGK